MNEEILFLNLVKYSANSWARNYHICVLTLLSSPTFTLSKRNNILIFLRSGDFYFWRFQNVPKRTYTFCVWYLAKITYCSFVYNLKKVICSSNRHFFVLVASWPLRVSHRFLSALRYIALSAAHLFLTSLTKKKFNILY